MEEELREFGVAAVEIVGPFVLTILSVLAGWALLKLKEKLGVDITAKQRESLDSLLEQAVGYAEETARNRLRTRGTAPKPNEKLEFAIDFLRSSGALDRTKDELERMLEAKLGVKRLEAQK